MLRKSLLLLSALLAVAVLTSPCFAGPVFAFGYSFPAFNPISISTSAKGTLFTEAGPFPNTYLITGIQGTRTVDGYGTSAITGILGPGSFFGNDNLLYYPEAFPGAGHLSFDGLSFTIVNTTPSSDGLGDINVFYNAGFGLYAEAGGYSDGGAFRVSPVPEPSSALPLLFVSAGFVTWNFRRRRMR